MNLLNLLIVGVFCIIGAGSTFAIVGYMIVILFQKFYRKVKFGIPLTK